MEGEGGRCQNDRRRAAGDDAELARRASRGRCGGRDGLVGGDHDVRRTRRSVEATRGPAARSRHRSRRACRRADGEQPGVSRGALGGTALRHALHGDQPSPPTRRSAVRPRRLRCVRAGDVRGDARRGRRARPVPHQHEDLRRRCPRLVRALRRPAGQYVTRPRRARAGGPRDALLLRHDGTTEGRAEGTAGHALR